MGARDEDGMPSPPVVGPGSGVGISTAHLLKLWGISSIISVQQNDKKLQFC
jgi:hypothetical protein